MKFGLNNYLYSVIVHLFYSYVVDCTLIDALGRPSKASSTELQVTCYGDIELTEVLDYTELHNDTDRHPVKRAAPTLADLLRRAYKNPGLKGRVLYTIRKSYKIHFSLGQVFSKSLVTKAILKVYKKVPRGKHLAKIAAKHPNTTITDARVSLLQIVNLKKELGSIKVLDSRRVEVSTSGWLSFDITEAVQHWTRDPDSNNGLELRINSIQPGRAAANLAKAVSFVPQKSRHKHRKPTLTIFFKQSLQ